MMARFAFFLLWGGTGLLILYFNGGAVYSYYTSKDWSQTKATITEMKHFQDQSSSSPYTMYYYIDLKYSYQVGEKTFYNNWIDATGIRSTRGYLAPSASVYSKYTKKFAKGNIVDVFYNPKNPKQSMLIRVIDVEKEIILTAIGVFIFLFGVFALFFAKIKKDNPLSPSN